LSQFQLLSQRSNANACSSSGICIDISTYLSWLFSTVSRLGGKVLKSSLPTAAGLSGVVAAAKQIFLQHNDDLKDDKIFAFVNCTGLSTRHFVGEDEGGKLFPIRGQTILVRGEAVRIIGERKFPILDGFLSKDGYMCMLPRY
jgi:hypothetical protein